MIGKRVEEYGLIEVIVEAYVIWGLHNTPCRVDRVSPGYVFNSLNMVGSWHDVFAIKKCKDPFRMIGESIPADDLDKRNKKNKININRVADSDDNGASWNRFLDYVDFGRKPR